MNKENRRQHAEQIVLDKTKEHAERMYNIALDKLRREREAHARRNHGRNSR